MKLDKMLTDEVIRLTRKYYKTSDTDYLPALIKAREILVERGISHCNIELIESLAHYTQISGKGSYDDIYKALAVFGIIVEDKEEQK